MWRVKATGEIRFGHGTVSVDLTEDAETMGAELGRVYQTWEEADEASLDLDAEYAKAHYDDIGRPVWQFAQEEIVSILFEVKQV